MHGCLRLEVIELVVAERFLTLGLELIQDTSPEFQGRNWFYIPCVQLMICLKDESVF